MKWYYKLMIIFLSGIVFWVLTGDIALAIFGVSLVSYLEFRM